MSRPPHAEAAALAAAAELMAELDQKPPADINPMDAAPAGIPPQLWASQLVDQYVEPTTSNYPGVLAINLDLPTRFARPWRLILNAPQNTQPNGGRDPLLNDSLQQGVFNLPRIIAPATALPPTLPAPAASMFTGRCVIRLGGDEVVADYPTRGAVWSLSTNKLAVMVMQEPGVGGVGARPARMHVSLQVGHAAPSWDTPTFTVRSPVAVNPAEAFQGAVPPRAVRCYFCPVPLNAGVLGNPVCRLWWYSIEGTVIDGVNIQAFNFNNVPPFRWDKYLVPPRAAFFAFENTAATDVWTNPSAIFDLSL